jgi:long-chain acyl-CoA synthetase
LGKEFHPQALILDPEFLPQVKELKEDTSNIRHLITTGDTPSGFPSYEDLLSNSSPEPLKDPYFQISYVLFSAGTTGLQKGINLYDIVNTFINPHEFSGPVRIKNAERRSEHLFRLLNIVYRVGSHLVDDYKSLGATPFYHGGALIANWVLALVFGGSFVYMRKFDPEEYLRLIEKERVTTSFAVSTMIHRILSLPPEVKSRYDLSSMKLLITGAAYCPAHLKRGINELFMCQGAKEPVLTEGYGSSEVAIVSVLNPQDYTEDPRRYYSVGRAMNARVKIMDGEKECPPGEQGAMFVQGLFTSSLDYIGGKERVEDGFRDIDGEKYFDEGVFASVDSEGFLYIGDRKKDMLKSGAVNIPSCDVEEVILEHPGVEDVAVIGAPDPEWGEKVMAVVQLKKGESVTEEEIIDFASRRLSSYKKPKIVKFLPSLPRREDGKMIKRELREMFFGGGK